MADHCGRLGHMIRHRFGRVLVCLLLSLTALSGGLLLIQGVRHQHEGGDRMHSHGRHSHSHSDHSHGHRHTHRHSHSHGRGHHHAESHDHGIPIGHAASSKRISASSDDATDQIGAHIHFMILGFELTLPDFLSEEPAPLVASESGQSETSGPQNFAGDQVRLPCPFSFAQLLHLSLHWVAVMDPGICPITNPVPPDVQVPGSQPGTDFLPEAPDVPPPELS